MLALRYNMQNKKDTRNKLEQITGSLKYVGTPETNRSSLRSWKQIKFEEDLPTTQFSVFHLIT
jgi:hypothetical protein